GAGRGTWRPKGTAPNAPGHVGKASAAFFIPEPCPVVAGRPLRVSKGGGIRCKADSGGHGAQRPPGRGGARQATAMQSAGAPLSWETNKKTPRGPGRFRRQSTLDQRLSTGT